MEEIIGTQDDQLWKKYLFCRKPINNIPMKTRMYHIPHCMQWWPPKRTTPISWCYAVKSENASETNKNQYPCLCYKKRWWQKPGAMFKKMTTVICFNKAYTKNDAAIVFNFRPKELLPHAMKNIRLWKFFLRRVWVFDFSVSFISQREIWYSFEAMLSVANIITVNFRIK